MRKSAEFGAVLSTPKENTVRSHSDYFSVCAVKSPRAGVHFGLTVGKKNAPLSVDRALVKRCLREASRTRRLAILEKLHIQDGGLDVSLRLKAKLPAIRDGVMNKQDRKKLLRLDVEKLYNHFLKRLDLKKDW